MCCYPVACRGSNWRQVQRTAGINRGTRRYPSWTSMLEKRDERENEGERDEREGRVQNSSAGTLVHVVRSSSSSRLVSRRPQRAAVVRWDSLTLLHPGNRNKGCSMSIKYGRQKGGRISYCSSLLCFFQPYCEWIRRSLTRKSDWLVRPIVYHQIMRLCGDINENK